MSAESKERAGAADSCEGFCHNEELVGRLRDTLPQEADVRRAEKFFSALGNRTRLLVLFCLCRAEELCVCDIANALQMNLSTVSHQLRHLRSCGLVEYRREGKMVFYRLADSRVRGILSTELECVEGSLAR